jgi:hypothetical protein
MRWPVLVTPLFVLGCDEPVEPAAPSATVPTASASTATPAVSAPPPVSKPPPLDLAALKKALRCGGAAGDGPCPVLDSFEKCREKWSPISQSGDGRWFGEGALVNQGAFVNDYFMLRTRRVPLDEVAAGALGVKVALDKLPDNPEVRSAAGPAWRALARSDIPKKGNRAIQFIDEYDKWSESFAQQADDHQIFVADGAGAYLCADPKTQGLHVVRLSNTREHPADGIYATLYPISW